MNNLKYYLAALFAFTLWGTFSLVLKPLDAYPSLDILFYRVFSCALIMTLISILFKRAKLRKMISYFRSLKRKDQWLLAGLNIGSSILLTANWFSFIYVMNHVSVRATSVAYLVCPIITTVLAYFILKDRLSKFQWLSVFLSLAGCLLLSYTSMIDMFYSGLIGLSYACYLISQHINKNLDKFLILNFHILLFYTIIPLFLNLCALSGISSSKVGMMLNINPNIAFILAGVVYLEPLGKLQICAYALIFIAVLVFNGSHLFKVKAIKPF